MVASGVPQAPVGTFLAPKARTMVAAASVGNGDEGSQLVGPEQAARRVTRWGGMSLGRSMTSQLQVQVGASPAIRIPEPPSHLQDPLLCLLQSCAAPRDQALASPGWAPGHQDFPIQVSPSSWETPGWSHRSEVKQA